MASSLTSENCKHGNAAPLDLLAGLPPSQAGAGRHKCAVCAYEAGFEAGLREALRRAQAGPSESARGAPN